MKLISLLFFLLPLACAQGGDNLNAYKHTELESDAVQPKAYASPPPNAKAANTSPQKQEQKIIKTASLRFETKDIEKTQQQISAIVNDNKGYFVSDNSYKNYNRINRNLEIRVPTENFQNTIDQISKGVTYFEQKQISRKDVTEEFIDLEARLKTKRALETRYIDLLKKAKDIKEILAIEKQIADIREEIEARQGRLNYLKSQVSMSTLSINFYKVTAETGITESYGQKIINAFKGGWDGVSVVFIGLIYLWPLFILAFILIIFLYIYFKRNKKGKKVS